MSELLPATPETLQLDSNWYDRLLEIKQLAKNQKFGGDAEFRSEQKRQFMEGEVDNPTLDYPFLDHDAIDVAEAEALTLKADILSQDPNAIVQQAYRWVLNEHIAGLRRRRATLDGEMHRFGRYSKFLFGSPSPDIFNYTTHSVRARAEKAINSSNPTIGHAAQNLLDVWPPDAPYVISALPNSEIVDYAHEQTTKEFSDLIDLPEQDELNADQIKASFEVAIGRVQADGWQVEIDDKTSRQSITVDQEEQKVLIPKSRQIKTDVVAGLIVHEIGTHVVRRINGERTRLKLLGLGLDRYESGDEGIGVMREQALKGQADDFRGIDGYLAVGLAVGLDGEPRNFRKVYSVLEKYYIFNNLISGMEETKATEGAKATAWGRCVRTFRGTDCKTAGVCSYRDMYYREGNIGVWDVVKNNPAELIRFNFGKYDPTNARHLWMLEKLGITEQDLDSLAQ